MAVLWPATTRARLPAATIAVLLAMTAGAAAAPLARVEADVTSPGPRVGRSFLGFSQEFQNVGVLTGDQSSGPHRPFLALLRRLGGEGRGAPTLRIGGGSTDLTYLDDGRHARPKGMVHAITPGFLANLARFVRASRSPVIFGINLGLNRAGLGADMARAVMDALPPGSVRALELGNEPDTYQLFDLYPGRRIRSQPWGPKRYLRQALRYDRAIRRAAPGAPVAGPSIIGGYRQWLAAFPRIVRAQRNLLSLVTIHQYPLLACGGRPGAPPRRVGPWALLGPQAVDARGGLLSGLTRIARRAGLGLRITEANSIACGGSPGASDAFAAALWGADWAFMTAAVGAQGVDFHMSSPRYAPVLAGYTGAGAAAVVQPLYYGMLFFAQATAHRARLLSSSYLRLRKRPGLNLRAWATYDRVDRVVRVAIIDKDRRGRGRVVVRVPQARGSGRLMRLSAPTVGSKRVTLGGQRFAAPTYDGRLLGRRRKPRVPRRRGNRFVVRMAGPGAALLTVPVRSVR